MTAVERDFAYYADLVAQHAEETLTLEFKRKPSPGLELQRSDKRLLGEAISGFANAVGGELVVGIDTEKHDRVDRAAKFREIDQVELVAGRYASYAHDAVSPPVEGLKVTSHVSAEGRGIIVVSIPQGNARPHMCRAPDLHTYFRRVGDTFAPMAAYEVEEMMRLKTSPNLQVVTAFANGGMIGGIRKLFLRFGVKNEARVTAKFPYIEYLHGPNQPRISDYAQPTWASVPASSTAGILFSAGADRVIHPDQTVFVSSLDIMERPHPSFTTWTLASLPEGEPLSIRFAFGCEDYPRTVADFSFGGVQLLTELWSSDP